VLVEDVIGVGCSFLQSGLPGSSPSTNHLSTLLALRCYRYEPMSLPLGGWKDRHKQLHNLPATPLFSCWPSVRHWKFKRRLIRVDAYHLNDLRGQITSGKCQLHLYSTCVTCGDVQERLAVMSVTDMLSMSESRLERQAVDCGATQNDTQRLVLAVSNLRHCIGWSFGLAYCKTSAQSSKYLSFVVVVKLLLH